MVTHVGDICLRNDSWKTIGLSFKIKTMVIKCELCEEEITKYEMDAGDFYYKLKEKECYVCDDCAKAIAIALIEQA